MTNVRDEGVIKFSCEWIETPPLIETPELAELIRFRDALFQENLISVYEDGIGFGNISIRVDRTTFLISASQTGHIKTTTPAHYSRVIKYNINTNSVTCEGAMKASSESLTHAMVYETFPHARAVVHVHNNNSWQKLQGKVPTSMPNVPYGTPAMANEIWRLSKELTRLPLLVMAGHEDGIIAFGETLERASKLAIDACRDRLSC